MLLCKWAHFIHSRLFAHKDDRKYELESHDIHAGCRRDGVIFKLSFDVILEASLSVQKPPFSVVNVYWILWEMTIDMAAFIWVATVARQWFGDGKHPGSLCSQRSPKINWPQRILCFPLKLQSVLSKLTFYIYLFNLISKVI